MSLESWKQEFYPYDASLVPSGLSSIEHSLQKWIGLRFTNLRRHGMAAFSDYIIDVQTKERFQINSFSCALCLNYACFRCPLYATLKSETCDADIESPYVIWVDCGDPEPMIEALQETLDGYYSNNHLLNIILLILNGIY